jgi:hypothetical protein
MPPTLPGETLRPAAPAQRAGHAEHQMHDIVQDRHIEDAELAATS